MKDEKHFCRCGICDKDFNSNEEWDAHAQTREHKEKVMKFRMMVTEARTKGEHVNVREFIKQIRQKAKEKKTKKPDGAEGFLKTIDDAYTLIECYEYGSIPQRDYLKACKYALEHFRKKYGKDSFWFRELFAHMQGDDWENSQKARCLVHAETIGCPHKTIAECDKYKDDIELKHLKGKKCQHCRYIEGVKEEWEKKLKRKPD